MMKTEKALLAAVFSIVFLFTSLAPAAEPDSNAICAEYGTTQTCPAVSGNYVVWQDNRLGGFDIYRNNGANPQDANSYLVCGFNRDQTLPAISGTTIVWQDHRATSGTSNPDIYKYLLPEGPENIVCNLSGKQQSPAISGDVIVWQDYRNTNSDIYGYRISDSTEFAICTDLNTQSYPAISGNIVVWQDARNGDADIYGKNLQTSEDIIVKQLSGSDQYYPAISGNFVVWQDNRNGDWDIYGKNLSTGVELEICKYIGSDQVNPAVSGDLVVWEDKRSGTSDIYGYRISTQTIFPICTRSSDQKNPAIDGSFVVWEEYKYDTNGDIYGAHIPEPVAPSIITITNPNGGEMILAGSAHTILWQTTGTPIAQVKLEYSTNNGTNYSLIATNYTNNGEYIWQPVPTVDSNQCKIKITDAAPSPAASDTSDNVFTIFMCNPALTADLSGDCKVDFVDFALFSGQWLDCGNPRDENWCP